MLVHYMHLHWLRITTFFLGGFIKIRHVLK